MASTAHTPATSVDHDHGHPTERVYIRIAIILTAITAIEVAIYYIDWMHDTGALVPVLVVLSVAKFVTVIGYYMHLKFDNPLFRWMFVAGLVVSIGIVAALAVLHYSHRISYTVDFLT